MNITTENKRCTGCGNTWTAPVNECDCGQGAVVFDGSATPESLRPAIEAALLAEWLDSVEKKVFGTAEQHVARMTDAVMVALVGDAESVPVPFDCKWPECPVHHGGARSPEEHRTPHQPGRLDYAQPPVHLPPFAVPGFFKHARRQP